MIRDNATSAMIDTLADEAEQRACFLSETGRPAGRSTKIFSSTQRGL